ncbi:MAG: hypothetical protein ACK438_02305, partial [Flavobacteriales bacterium]
SVRVFYCMEMARSLCRVQQREIEVSPALLCGCFAEAKVGPRKNPDRSSVRVFYCMEMARSLCRV